MSNHEELRREFEAKFLQMSPRDQEAVLEALQEVIDKLCGVGSESRRQRVRMLRMGIEPPPVILN